MSEQRFRKRFRNDEAYIKWIESCNRTLNKEALRMEKQLESVRQERDDAHAVLHKVRADTGAHLRTWRVQECSKG